MIQTTFIWQANDTKVRGLGALFAGIDKLGVRIGLPDSESTAKGELTLAQLGLVHEFGIPGHIPARPFLSQGMARAKASALRIMGALVAKLKTDSTPAAFKLAAKSILEKVGAFVANDVKKGIATGGFAPNAKSTEERKGSTKPLIDTGLLRQSITWVVEGAK